MSEFWTALLTILGLLVLAAVPWAIADAFWRIDHDDHLWSNDEQETRP